MNCKTSFATIIYFLTHENEMILTEEDQKRRMDICLGCDQCTPFTAEDQGMIDHYGKKDLHSCQRCGCILENKTQFFSERCPDFKWTPSQSEWKPFYEESLKKMKENDYYSEEHFKMKMNERNNDERN